MSRENGLTSRGARRLHSDSMIKRLRASIGVVTLAGFLFCGECWAGADVNDGWIEVCSPHFVVSSNGGERDARRIADHFEQIRSLFHTVFEKLRVDPAQPVLILAAKNETTMKLLLP